MDLNYTDSYFILKSSFSCAKIKIFYLQNACMVEIGRKLTSILMEFTIIIKINNTQFWFLFTFEFLKMYPFLKLTLLLTKA